MVDLEGLALVRPLGLETNVSKALSVKVEQRWLSW